MFQLLKRGYHAPNSACMKFESAHGRNWVRIVQVASFAILDLAVMKTTSWQKT